MLFLTLLALLQDPHPEQVEAWVKKLSSDEVAVREEAAKKLMEFGEKVVPFLEKHAKTGDPETQSRIAEVIKRLTTRPLKLDDFAAPARAALQEASKPERWRPQLREEVDRLFSELGEDGAADSLKFVGKAFREAFGQERAVSRKLDPKMEKATLLLDKAEAEEIEEALVISNSAEFDGPSRRNILVILGNVKGKRIEKSLIIATGKVEAEQLEDCIVFAGDSITCTRRARHCTLQAAGAVDVDETKDVTFINTKKRKVRKAEEERDIEKMMLPRQN